MKETREQIIYGLKNTISHIENIQQELMMSKDFEKVFQYIQRKKEALKIQLNYEERKHKECKNYQEQN